MSLVTSCPACATSFHVKPEQLSMHRGDVRCGKCGHVFNALDRLAEAPEDVPPLPAPAAPIEDVPPLPAPAAPIIAPATSTAETASLNITDFNMAPATAETPKFFDDVASKAKLQSPVRHRYHTWALACLAVLLLLLAVAQTSYYLRAPIATHWPALKPYLVKACDLVNCTVELPKNADQLAIDDSDLHEDAEHQGLIHLSATLINRAPFAQAYPLLELTLTDTDDKPLLRRHFTPSEYLPTRTDVSKGIPPNEDIHIKLTLTAGEVPAAGYRVFVTYP